MKLFLNFRVNLYYLTKKKKKAKQRGRKRERERERSHAEITNTSLFSGHSEAAESTCTESTGHQEALSQQADSEPSGHGSLCSSLL